MIVLLIDERPGVTDMQRSIKGMSFSTFDELWRTILGSRHGIGKGERLVEQKKDVVIPLDSITRLARANNMVVPLQVDPVR